MGPVGCPKTSIRNCHYSLRNYPEESRYVQVVNSLRNIYIFARVSALHIKSIHMLAILCFCCFFFFKFVRRKRPVRKVSCTVVVLTCFMICGCVYVWVLQCVGVCVSVGVLTIVWVFW